MPRDWLSRNGLTPERVTFSLGSSGDWATASGPDSSAPFLFRNFVTGEPDAAVRTGANRPGPTPQAFMPPTSGVAGNGLPVYSWDQAAAQLTRSGTSWSGSLGAPASVTYGFRSSAPAVMPDGTGGFTQFSAAQIAAAELALQLWSDVANITFVRANPGGYTNSATILFGNYSTGAPNASAFAFFPGSTSALSVDGDVWVNSTVAANADLTLGTFGPQVLAHEIGHAIGLSHPGDYDASDGTPPAYETDAVYWQDARAFTIMSYFGSVNVGFSLNAFAAGPQLHDIAAAQLLYGANMSTRTGDTIYGFNSNAGRATYAITADGQSPVFAIWDAGGNDTLDLSGYSTTVEIDLREEAFSSAGPGNSGIGIAHGNIAIARGAVIENGIGGSADDVLIGNAVANVLNGGAGADAMSGGAGDDTYVVDNIGDVVTENASEGTDLVQASISYTLGADIENLILTGGAAINGTGNGLNNTILGNGAANVLNGGVGADAMTGGAGDDTYVVDNAGDTVTENASEGTDLVQASVNYTLSADVENLTLTGSALNGTGNGLNNAITGNAQANTLDGGAGADVMAGGAGDDTYIVDNSGDVAGEAASAGTDNVQASVTYTLGANVENLTLTGAAAISGFGNIWNNTITGNGAANQLNGFDGADTLDGGAGADNMFGGNGDDIYIVDNAGDQTTEVSALGGTDTVFSSVARNLTANIENLTLTGVAAITAAGNSLNNILTGNSAANTLYGFDGNDRLDGGAGADTLFGANGDDVYVVDDVNDITVEGSPTGGTDTVETFISRNLNANFENMILMGTAAIAYGNVLNNVLTGNASANSLYGFDGNDTLDGGTGADQMFGANGDDTYIVDNAADVTSEVSALGGIDTVISSVTRNLTANLENLTLTGNAAITGAGNVLDNVLIGNAAANTLFGLDGADTLDGGLGADTLQGGPGADAYVFSSALGAGNIDTIVNFSVVDDTIRLDIAIFTGLAAGVLDAAAFHIGAAAGDADDRIIYDSATGALYFDADGDAGGAQLQFATLAAGLALTNDDFLGFAGP